MFLPAVIAFNAHAESMQQEHRLARMAQAMALATKAGRDALLAGAMPRRSQASASSPKTGLVGS